MGSETRYLFDTDFSNPQASEKKAHIYSEDDLAAARLEGAQMARAELAGLEEKRAADLLAQLSASLDGLTAQHTDHLRSANQHAIDIAVAICRKALPTLSAQNALHEIEGHISRTLAEIHDEPRIVVRVSERNLAALQARIDSVAGAFDGKIVLLADDALPDTDCHVQWADGGSERAVQRTWAEIEKAVAHIVDAGIGACGAPPAPGGGLDTADQPDAVSRGNSDLDQLSQVID